MGRETEEPQGKNDLTSRLREVTFERSKSLTTTVEVSRGAAGREDWLFWTRTGTIDCHHKCSGEGVGGDIWQHRTASYQRYGWCIAVWTCRRTRDALRTWKAEVWHWGCTIFGPTVSLSTFHVPVAVRLLEIFSSLIAVLLCIVLQRKKIRISYGTCQIDDLRTAGSPRVLSVRCSPAHRAHPRSLLSSLIPPPLCCAGTTM